MKPPRWVRQRLLPLRRVKRLLPRGLFARSLLIVTLPVLLVQLVTSWVFFDRHYQTLSRRLAYGVAGEVAFLVEALPQARTAEARDRLMHMANQRLDLLVALNPRESLTERPVEPWSPFLESVLTDALAGALPGAPTDAPTGAPAGTRSDERFVISLYDPERSIEIRVALGEGTLSVIVPQRRLYSSTSVLVVAWMLGSAAVLLGIAILFLRNQVRPIRRLAVAAERIGKGQAIGAFKVEGAAEVRQAAAAFLEMRDRIDRMLEQRTEMLAGVSHDLRTPITRMRLQIALMGDGPEIDDLLLDLDEMEQMIAAYLAFARDDEAEAAAPLALPAFLEMLAIQARREGGEVMVGAVAEVRPVVRVQALRRCLMNLIGNATRYGGRVWLSASVEEGKAPAAYRPGGGTETHRTRTVLIAVDDDGPGIPETEREAVFRAFVRADGSRNPATGGVGLGLTIARDIARRHGGDVVLADSPQGGLRALVSLPL